VLETQNVSDGSAETATNATVIEQANSSTSMQSGVKLSTASLGVTGLSLSIQDVDEIDDLTDVIGVCILV
jgi:hypothetical protein